MSVLKADLVSGLLRALATNARRQQPTVRLFEIGKHFTRAGEGVGESRWLALALTGARADLAWYASRDPVDVYDAKGLAEHVLARLGAGATEVDAGTLDHRYFERGRWARLLVGGEEVAVFGEVARGVQEAFGVPSPVVSAAIALDVVARLAGSPARFAPLPRHPSVQRDIALVLPLDRPAADVEQAIREAGGPLLRTVTLFDLYTGQGVEGGARSVAWRLGFRADDRTLTDAEVNDAYRHVVETVRRRFGVEVRGT
jgi:phenylalanyl-tRNA synthetase beta chain